MIHKSFHHLAIHDVCMCVIVSVRGSDLADLVCAVFGISEHTTHKTIKTVQSFYLYVWGLSQIEKNLIRFKPGTHIEIFISVRDPTHKDKNRNLA